MYRKLKRHESKLLRKTDFLKYREETKSNEDKVIRNYYLQNREDYKKYNKLTGEVTSLVHHLRYLKPSSKVRMQITQQFLDKLHSMGVTDQRGICLGIWGWGREKRFEARVVFVFLGVGFPPGFGVSGIGGDHQKDPPKKKFFSPQKRSSRASARASLQATE